MITVIAHGLVGRRDLPIPEELFFAAAALVLVVSFVALGALWSRPRLEQPRERAVLPLPTWLDVIPGAVGLVLFATVVYAGLAGTQSTAANLAPTAIFVLFWVGIPVLSLLLGDVWAALSPWRAVGRGVGWVAGRAGGDALPAPIAYPERLGRWPAALGLLAFAWVELVWSAGDEPRALAILALVYFGVMVVGMSVFGERAWTRNADAFGVYFGLYAALAPLARRAGRLVVRAPLAGASELRTAVPGTVTLLCVAIGTTAFDGASEGEPWVSLSPGLQAFFVDLGLSPQRGLEAAFTVGLLAFPLLVAAIYALGVAGMRARGGEPGLARRFAHSLVPIALAYVVAHYFSLLAYQGQAVVYLAADPLGNGSDTGLGDPGRRIDYSVVSATGIWYVQVATLVAGHVAGLLLAHDRALVVWRGGRTALASQVAMLVVMVCFTTLGLYLLSAASR